MKITIKIGYVLETLAEYLRKPGLLLELDMSEGPLDDESPHWGIYLAHPCGIEDVV